VRFELDASYRRTAAGALIVGGSPLRLFRLSPAGQAVADALEAGQDLPANHAALTDRLVDAGAIHPLPVNSTATAGDVTVVVPAWRRVPTLAGIDGVAAVVVVDDGSDPPLVAGAPATVVRLPDNRGPAAARNAGLATVTTAFVAFVDTDVEPGEGWLDALLGHLADERVALVAPRVVSAPGGSAAVDLVEGERGSLDLGPARARIAPGSRVSYVPAAALVCRTAAVRAVGGFDDALRWGEDVDLVWRLVEAGWRCRYEPSVVLTHRARTAIGGWLRQQYEYGTSAAPLAARHPGALAPLRTSGWTLAAWALVAVRRPFAALLLTAGTVVALQRKLRGLPPVEATDLVVRGTVAAGEQIAAAIVRTWWPLAVPLLAVRRTRPAIVAALVATALLGSWRARSSRPAVSAALRLAAEAAYGAGVWRGAIRERSLAALTPDLANWPPRRARGGPPA
jgi:mycofactocin system glycosyltransferase